MMGRPKGSRPKPGSKKPGPKRPHSDLPMSLEEIAVELGCSRQNVNVIELRALKKLRAGLEAKGIDEALWLDYLRDLHKRQRTHYTVSTEFIAVSRFRTLDEAEQAACSSHAAE